MNSENQNRRISMRATVMIAAAVVATGFAGGCSESRPRDPVKEILLNPAELVGSAADAFRLTVNGVRAGSQPIEISQRLPFVISGEIDPDSPIASRSGSKTAMLRLMRHGTTSEEWAAANKKEEWLVKKTFPFNGKDVSCEWDIAAGDYDARLYCFAFDAFGDEPPTCELVGEYRFRVVSGTADVAESEAYQHKTKY